MSFGLVVTLLIAASPVQPAQEAPEAHGARLLQAVRAATGDAAWDKIKALTVRARRQIGDETAEEQVSVDSVSGKLLVTVDDGPDAGRSGFDGKTAWSQDSEGVARSLTGPEAASLLAEAFWRSNGWSRAHVGPSAAGAGWVAATWLRDETVSGRHYDVLHVALTGGASIELWLDRTSHLPARIVVPDGATTKTVHLSGWRKAGGVSVPGHIATIHSTEGSSTNETVTAVDSSAAFDPAKFGLPTAPAVDYVFPGAIAAVAVPIRVLNDHVFLDARVTGVTLHMMFVSGASTSLDPTALGKLSVKSAKSGAATVRLPEMKVGGVLIRHPTVQLQNLAPLAATEGVAIDGIIGAELLKRLVVEIDYESRRMALVKSESFVAPPSAVLVPLELDGRNLSVNGRLDGISMKFAVDTGSRPAITLDPAALQALADSATRWPVAPYAVDGADQQPVIARLARAGSFELGVIGIAQPLVALVPGDMPTIGGAMLRRFDVIFDERHKHLLLQQNPAAAQNVRVNHSGLWLSLGDEVATVTAVLPDSPAQKAGIRKGDTVTSAGEDTFAALGLSELRDQLDGPVGSAVTLGLRRDGQPRSVRLVLTDPFVSLDDKRR